MDILRKGTRHSPETLRELCVSTKFSHQKIRWNYGVLRSSVLCFFLLCLVLPQKIINGAKINLFTAANVSTSMKCLLWKAEVRIGTNCYPVRPGIWKQMDLYRKKNYLDSPPKWWMLRTSLFPKVIYKFME